MYPAKRWMDEPILGPLVFHGERTDFESIIDLLRQIHLPEHALRRFRLQQQVYKRPYSVSSGHPAGHRPQPFDRPSVFLQRVRSIRRRQYAHLAVFSPGNGFPEVERQSPETITSHPIPPKHPDDIIPDRMRTDDKNTAYRHSPSYIASNKMNAARDRYGDFHQKK